jgi:PAT family beta-lactamase induction signal transducer AmpG
MSKFIAVFTNRKMLITLLLGFSGGLPLSLVGSTLQAWLAREQIDIATIGLFALIGLPYALKFLWAPFIDNIELPFLGLRRGWMAVTQIGLFITTVAFAYLSPTTQMPLFSALAFLVAFFSASQDIVIDAYRTEIIDDQNQLGAAASTYVTGYRIATLVSGGIALSLADHMSWTAVYVLMAGINLVGFITILFAPEPKVVKKVQITKFKESVVMPFLEFFQRHGAMEILIFIMVYKLSVLMAVALNTKFLVDLGYSNTMIGTVSKSFGLIFSILGTITGGALMAKLGLKRSLWTFGIVQASVGLTFCLLSSIVSNLPAEEHKNIWLIIIVSLDQFMMGLGTAALVGFMMNFCSKQFTGTQYALLTSVMAVTRVILVAHAGDMVKHMGYNAFFLSTIPMALPGLLLLRRFDQWQTLASVNAKKISNFDLGLIALFVLSLVSLSSDPIWSLMGLKTVSSQATWFGAVGIVILILVGLLRPYFDKQSSLAKT